MPFWGSGRSQRPVAVRPGRRRALARPHRVPEGCRRHGRKDGRGAARGGFRAGDLRDSDLRQRVRAVPEPHLLQGRALRALTAGAVHRPGPGGARGSGRRSSGRQHRPRPDVRPVGEGPAAGLRRRAQPRPHPGQPGCLVEDAPPVRAPPRQPRLRRHKDEREPGLHRVPTHERDGVLRPRQRPLPARRQGRDTAAAARWAPRRPRALRRRELPRGRRQQFPLRSEEELVAKSLARIAARRDLEVVLLPIGWCHGDLDALRLVQRAGGNRFTLVEDLDSPLETGAVIGACDYFVGSSLHGNLTALSFEIPHIVVNNPLRSAKLEGLVQLARMEELRITGWEDLEDGFDRLAATPRERWATVGDHLKARVSEHFDRLADLILQAATERRKPDGMTHTATPRRAGTEKNIPLEVYGTLAELHEQLDDERASRHATEEELRNGLLIQRSVHREQLERYRARVEHLEARVGHFKTRGENLETEIEYLRTQLRKLKAQNESLSGTLRDIKESRIWRLFGSYRRLRAKISALTRPKSENAKESAATRFE